MHSLTSVSVTTDDLSFLAPNVTSSEKSGFNWVGLELGANASNR